MSFLAEFAELSAVGATPGGGVDREAGSAADGQARDWLVARLGEAGCRVRVDAIGNVFGTVELVPGAPTVLVGSHLDSQPRAGRFDGAYGVLAAVHAVRRVAEQVRVGSVTPRFNVAVVDWFNEEGSRFTPSIMGSGVYTGALDLASAAATTDPTGVTVAEALARIGYAGTATAPEAAAYAEIHIEQGRTLEDRGIDIGLVHANWAAHKVEISVHGEQAHTGATHMADRRDALVGAARLVVLARELVDEFAPGELLTAVGRFQVHPNSPVVVPRRVDLTLDVRSADPELLDRAWTLLAERFAGAAAACRVDLEILRSSRRDVVELVGSGVDLAARAAAEVGASSLRMRTMAGHDAIALHRLVPTVLVFVPSVDGVSHAEHEHTADDDLLRGVDVLTGIVGRLVAGELADEAP